MAQFQPSILNVLFFINQSARSDRAYTGATNETLGKGCLPYKW